MYEVTSHSFSMQAVSNGSQPSAGSYGSGYYGDPPVTLLSAASANAVTYVDMLIQPNAVCYASSYNTDSSPGIGCKQSYYHQEGSYGSDCQNSLSKSLYHEAGGHHPGRVCLLYTSDAADE